jgi:hypothetical protein
MRFHFIEVRRVDYPVRVMCNVLDVSRAGYYAWRPRPESMRSAENRELLEDIQQVHCDNREGAMATPVFKPADPLIWLRIPFQLGGFRGRSDLRPFGVRRNPVVLREEHKLGPQGEPAGGS